MQKHLLYISFFTLTSALAFGACADKEEVIPEKPSYEKDPVSLSVGLADADFGTRAVITDGEDKNKRAFTGDTRLFFIMVADKEATPGTVSESKYGLNYAKAAGKSNPEPESKSDVAFDNNYLYWDDAYARDSKISIYSLAVANKERGNVGVSIGSVSKTISPTDKITPFTSLASGSDITFRWELSDEGKTYKEKKYQSDNSISWQDLIFSNNIANYSPATYDSSKDKRLRFSNTVSGKFDKGTLVYYHALTKITIKLYAGEGFKADGTDFKFPSDDDNVALTGFYGAGTFDLKKGEFTSQEGIDYSKIKNTKTVQNASVGPYYTLEAYLIPGTDLSSDVSDALSFTIDGNKYDISRATLLDRIRANSDNVDTETNKILASVLKEGKYMLPGVNYEFSFKVGKTKIQNLSAQILDWEGVNALEHPANNARIHLSLEDRGVKVTSNISLYRKSEETTNITDDITSESGKGYLWWSGYSSEGSGLDYSATLNHWTTNWNWPNNKTFYHFRAVSPASPSPFVLDETNDYLSLTHGEDYTDVSWGAPFKELDGSATATNEKKLNYSLTYGFDGDGTTNGAHQINEAIGPTDDQIKMLMFHLMSDVTFRVQTSTEESEKVELYKTETVDGVEKKYYTTIELKGIYKSGTALMGNGLVSPSETRSDYSFGNDPTQPTGATFWAWNNYGAIPQELTDDVVLVITTPDHNRYEVPLKNIVAASATDGAGNTIAAVSTTNLKNPYTETTTGSGQYKIDRWYPHYKYTYTFTLKKKGVTDVAVTILDWETVNAGQDNVQIK